jgi:hypothetical protein
MGDLIWWLEHADPLKLTAWATIAVAFVGAVSIVANFALAWQARASARASRAGLKLQADELGTLQRQLKLAEDQFAAARDAAQPRLRAALARAGDLYISGSVAYVHGSEPADEIHLWIRGPSRPGAGWGLHTARIGFMSASDRELPFTAIPASAQQQEQNPFPTFLDEEPGRYDFWVGLIWQRLDGSTDRLSEKQTLKPWSSVLSAPDVPT